MQKEDEESNSHDNSGSHYNLPFVYILIMEIGLCKTVYMCVHVLARRKPHSSIIMSQD
jgi:hypothetical protein